MPAAPAIGATSNASEATIRRICLGVAPIARSRANSRRRWPIARATVESTTNTAANVAMPPNEPPIAVSSSRALENVRRLDVARGPALYGP